MPAPPDPTLTHHTSAEAARLMDELCEVYPDAYGAVPGEDLHQILAGLISTNVAREAVCCAGSVTQPTGSRSTPPTRGGLRRSLTEHHEGMPECLPFTKGCSSEPSTLSLSLTKSRIASSNSTTPPRLQSTMMPIR
jgi:hypothetical protein